MSDRDGAGRAGGAEAEPKAYDVFVSYSSADEGWVVEVLYPRLEQAGLRCADTSAFTPGGARVLEVERVVGASRWVVLVISPDYVRDQWAGFGNVLATTRGIEAGSWPVVPLIHRPCALPGRLASLVAVDLQAGDTREWARLIQTLGGQPTPAPGETAPYPPIFMADDLLPDLVERPREHEALVAHLLDGACVPVALRGAGGFGKTTIARTVCHDARIRAAFPDGILWVTLGQAPDVARQLLRLYEALTAERPALVDAEDAAIRLAGALAGRRCLVVIDDVWHAAHLRPFLRGGDGCARLITTRNSDTLPAGTRTVTIDAMRREEALALLGAGLPAGEETALRRLATRLGEWPLLLKLANGALRARVIDAQQSLPDALAYVNRVLDRRGLTALDARDPQERDQAAAMTLGLSLDLLDVSERDRYAELAVFPEDTDVPLAAVERLWQETGGLDDLETEELCLRLGRLSLLQQCDLALRRIRMHDVVRAYLVGVQREALPALHGRLLAAYGVDRWPALAPGEPYLWPRLAYHLRQAGRADELHALLLDPEWMAARLAHAHVNALLADYDVALEPEGEGAAALIPVRDAIRLAAHVLARDRDQLAAQLWGRLAPEGEMAGLLERLRARPAPPWLRPLWPTLAPAGGALQRTLTGHADRVWGVALTLDGRRAVSASGDKTLKVWDLRRGELVRTLTGHASSVRAVALTPDGRYAVSASYDQTLMVWDLQTGEVVRALRGHEGSVEVVALTPDGRCALSGSTDKTIRVWDLEAGETVRILDGHVGSVTALAVTPDGRRAVSGAGDHTLQVWDLERGALAYTLGGHTGWVRGVALTPDGRRALSAADDRTLRVWDLETGELVHTLAGHVARVRGAAVTPDGRYALSGSDDHTLKVWDLARGELVRTLGRHAGWVRGLAVSADGQQMVSASDDQTLKVWDLTRQEAHGAPAGHADSVRGVAVTADGRYAVSGSEDQTLKVWDLARGEVVRTLAGHRARVRCVAVSADGRCALSASEDKTLKVWDLESGEEVRTLAGHTAAVYAVALTPDGWAVSAGADSTLRVWDLATGEALRTLTGHRGRVRCVAVTADGRYALSGSEDQTVRVWDLATGELARTLSGHGARVRGVAVSADGRCALSASDDETLRVWDLETGDLVRTLSGHASRVRCVALTADGRRALSGADDQTLKVWDLASGQALATFYAEGGVYGCAATRDGLIAAGDASGRVHFLRLERDDPG